MVTGHILHARSWAASGRFDCTESAEAGLAAARLLGDAGEEWEASQAGVLAQTVLVHAGRFAQAEELTEGLVRFLRRVGHHAVEMWVLRNTATVALLRSGDLDAHAAFVEQFTEVHRSLGEPRLDAYRGGSAAVRERWAYFRATRSPGPWPSAGDRLMAIAGAEAWAAVGEHAEAAALYPQIAEASAHGTVIAWDDLRLLATAAGLSAAAGGNWELAETHFAEALRQADTLPHRLEQPEVRRLWAEALLNRQARADADRARELLTAALDAYRRLGMPRHASLTEADLARC